MAERFGQHIIRDDGSLDRAAVAAIVFGDDPQARAALADLNGIVHPAMQAEIRRQIDAQSATDRVVVLDFPLLTENPRDGSGGHDRGRHRSRRSPCTAWSSCAAWTSRTPASGSPASRRASIGWRATHVIHNDGTLIDCALRSTTSGAAALERRTVLWSGRA